MKGADAWRAATGRFWVVTAVPGAAWCQCRMASGRVKEYVTTRPAGVAHGQDRVMAAWVKRRWDCREPSSPRKSFTGSLPGIPPRCRLTARLREHAAALVAAGGRPTAGGGQAASPPQTSRHRGTIQPHHASTHDQIIAVLYRRGFSRGRRMRS